MGSGATPPVFLLPLPRVPTHGLGPEAGLRQADYETPLSFGSCNSRGAGVHLFASTGKIMGLAQLPPRHQVV